MRWKLDKKEETYLRPNETENDDFYRKWTQTIREFMNYSRTSLAQMTSADESMSAIFDRIATEKSKLFPDTKDAGGDPDGQCLEMTGNYGDSTLQNQKKRGKYG